MDSVASILQELQAYYSKELTDTQLQVYVRTLSDLDITMLRQGADDLIRSGSPFMPKVAELRKAARRFTPAPQGKVANEDYWKAMAIFNDVRLPMPPELEQYIVCEVTDATPSD